MRYFLEIAYQGTHYHGWQVQPNAITIQGTIQAKLSQLLQQPVIITGSSRTDTGVHAQQQWAHIDLAPNIDPAKLCHQANAVLPPDISLLAIHPVIPEAHARFDAWSRTYEYRISSIKNPFLRETHHIWYGEIDILEMNQAAAILRHKTDFTSFSKMSPELAHYQCVIMEAKWMQLADHRLIFYIQANRFLRGMVRSIVANLWQVGLGKMPVTAFEALIDRKDRQLGASLVPACGLTLTQVTYPAEVFIK